MAMRNYGAMLDAKLMKCIAELRAGQGDAVDRIVAKQQAHNLHKPESSIPANLKVAMGVARSRGLGAGGINQGPAPVAPEPAKVNTVCRGCGGTGVDHSVHTRMLQVAEGPWTIGPKPGAKRLTTTVVALGTGSPALRVTGKPLALMLTTLAKAKAEGREVRHQVGDIPFPLGKEHACTWCHGTGEPQLSTQVLQARIDAT
jgi:hypothetical protein